MATSSVPDNYGLMDARNHAARSHPKIQASKELYELNAKSTWAVRLMTKKMGLKNLNMIKVMGQSLI